jgi:hypothetical protein
MVSTSLLARPGSIQRRLVCEGVVCNGYPVLLPDNLFSGLPAELSRELFAKARILPLKADSDGVSVGGSEGDERILAIHRGRLPSTRCGIPN